MIGRREPSLPPGPPTIPLLGNLNIFPTEYAHYKFTDWAKEYGDIYSLKIGPGTVVVITSMEAIRELMEKRSGSTVDCPPNYMADNITGGLNMVLARYGSKWQILWKTAHAILTPHAVTAHLPIQIAESTQVMYDLLKAPELFYTHIRHYSNLVMMSLLYGKRSPRYETHEALLFFESQHLWELALEPGAHPPVDVLPFLRYVPRRWAPWKALCDKTREAQRKLYFGLLDECMKRVQRGKENGCYMEEVIKHQDEFGLDRELSGYLGGVMIEGVSDTTSSFLQSLILLLTAFPNVQRKAHKEMDRVVGDQRVPTLDDVPHLPYIQAIIKEACISTTGCQEVNSYRGYVIPEGSTIFVNTYICDDPKIFNPD
ncbi:cytochrome partial [Lentinula edodes]|uniref:Cytochrome partial n=1 Tax=Lentinula edodes TaxID=5353 RepID=A0A1Q3ECU5_LENED|nr:cytochrome partial [Lentinula edodes]